MARALTTLLVLLLGAAVLPTAALAVDGDGETTFEVPLRADHGLTAKLEADDDEIELTIRRGGQQAVYIAPGEVTPDGISVRFADLGEFVVDYEPFRTLKTRGPYRHCRGEPYTITEGFFRGTLRFRGEGGYVNIEASRVKGTLDLRPPWQCDYRRAAASRAAEPQPRPQKAGPVPEDRATLGVRRRSDSLQLLAIASRQEGERPTTVFWATSEESREGMGVIRFTLAGSRSTAGFEFDNSRGTAFIDPPAPYAGSAHFRRRAHGPDLWQGSLTVPLLGLGRVPLTGPGFAAAMAAELPQFE